MWLGELARLLAGPADLGLDREAMLAELAWGLLTGGGWRRQVEEHMAEERPGRPLAGGGRGRGDGPPGPGRGWAGGANGTGADLPGGPAELT